MELQASISHSQESARHAVPRVAFVTSHPIQYQVPVFRELARRDDLEFQVLFAMLPDAKVQGAGFGVAFQWDVPLLEGYEYQVLNNVAKTPSVTNYAGCDTPKISSVIREKRFDVVVVNGWVVKTCLQALFACLRQRIPCLVRGEANDLRYRAGYKRLAQRLLVNRFDGVLPIGIESRKFYQARGIGVSRMFDSPYCVDNSSFSSIERNATSQAQARQRFGLSADRVVLIFCGKFEDKKHPLELLQAVAQAVKSGARLELLMVGDGPLRRSCEEFVSQKQLPVHFAGFLNQSEIRQAYLAADLLVMPSDHGETWGLVVNEAFASGIPAVVSDQVGCASDLIHPGETGECFRFGDWDSLAELLVRLANDSGHLAEMGQRAKSLIANYSPQVAAEGIARGALWAASRRPRRA